jgi:hypothetical protein
LRSRWPAQFARHFKILARRFLGFLDSKAGAELVRGNGFDLFSTISRAARALGKRVIIRLADAKAARPG